jgi:hypothetical protein
MQRNEEKLDQWLDSALRQYGATEARSGLEGRIAARLAAEAAGADRRTWWTLAGATAVVVVMVGLWLGRSTQDRTAREALVSNTPVVNERPEGSDHSTIASSPVVNRPKARGQRKHVEHSVSVVESRRLPRREVFPSRQPSEQYRLLAEYVTQTPKDEVVSALDRHKNAGDLRVEELDIAPLNSETVTLESDQTN